jgi:hypothetical protein
VRVASLYPDGWCHQGAYARLRGLWRYPSHIAEIALPESIRGSSPQRIKPAPRPRDRHEAMDFELPTHPTVAGNFPSTKDTTPMTDQFPPPGWFPRPATWPYWPSLRDAFTPPQPPSDPWNQINAQWWQQPVGANARATTTSQPNDAWDRTTLLGCARRCHRSRAAEFSDPFRNRTMRQMKARPLHPARVAAYSRLSIGGIHRAPARAAEFSPLSIG